MNAIDHNTVGVTVRLQTITPRILHKDILNSASCGKGPQCISRVAKARLASRVECRTCSSFFTSSMQNDIMATVASALLSISAHFRKGEYTSECRSYTAQLRNTRVDFTDEGTCSQRKVPRLRWVHHNADQDAVEMLDAHDDPFVRLDHILERLLVS